jgi:hypothetical protein
MFWVAPLIGGALGAVVYGLVATRRGIVGEVGLSAH